MTLRSFICVYIYIKPVVQHCTHYDKCEIIHFEPSLFTALLDIKLLC